MSSNSFKELQEAISNALVATTRTTGLIANEDLAFQRASDPSIGPLIEQQKTRLLDLAQQLISVAVTGTPIPAPPISDADAIDNHWNGVVEVIDNVLERADASLDSYTGLIKRPTALDEEQANRAADATSRTKRAKPHNAQRIEKPQLSFLKRPSNHDNTPFKPFLTSKPHATVPLDEALTPVIAEGGTTYYLNPYEREIQCSSIPSCVRTKSDATPYLPFDSTSAVFVDTLEAVHAMLSELKEAREIAIDLEHHDEHSFIGIVSLMQISTRQKDWIVDTLKPWRHELEVLNEVFADPGIIKVLHGSTMDIIWLQRDLGLYLVGLFDTYHASWALGYPKHSLAFLLKKFVDFDAAKQYQMADWRIRPLPKEMFDYARSDTHFLLYIYDMMRNDLIDNSESNVPGGDLIEIVMSNSKEEALQRYERPRYDEAMGSGQMGWANLLYRNPALFNGEQFAVFRAVHQWRDQVAREEDENINFVIAKKSLFSLAKELPTDMPSMLRCIYPINLPLQKRKRELLNLVREARTSGRGEPDMQDFFIQHAPSLTGSYRVRHERPRKVADHSVGTVLKALSLNNSLPLKADASMLWGSNLVETQHHVPKLDAFRLEVPLPQLTDNVFLDPNLVSKSSDAQPMQSEGPPLIKEHLSVNGQGPEESADTFVVRDFSGLKKRRRSSPTERAVGEVLNVDVGLRGVSGSSVREDADQKRMKRERRLEAKRLKQERNGGANGIDKLKAEAETEPFDYSKAPSVLQDSRKPDTSGTQKKKSVNPYAKSLDTRTGLPNTRKEMPGKTMTFSK